MRKKVTIVLVAGAVSAVSVAAGALALFAWDMVSSEPSFPTSR